MNLMTTQQVADRLNLSEQRIRALCAAGTLPAQKIGRQWLIREKDLAKIADRKPGRPRTA